MFVHNLLKYDASVVYSLVYKLHKLWDMDHRTPKLQDFLQNSKKLRK